MLKYLGPTGKALSGDLEKSRSLLGPARLLAQRCMERLTAKGGQGQEFMQQVLADGSKLKALVIGGMGAPVAKVWIDTVFGEVEGSWLVAFEFEMDTGLLDSAGDAWVDPAVPSVVYTNDTIRAVYASGGGLGKTRLLVGSEGLQFDGQPYESIDPLYDSTLLKLSYKQAMATAPPSIQTGRMRAFMQAVYGALQDGDGKVRRYLRPLFYNQWIRHDGVVLTLINPTTRREIAETCACSITNTTGIYVDGIDYFMIRIGSTRFSARKIELSEDARRMLSAAKAAELPPDDFDKVEAYAFSTAWWGDEIQVDGIPPSVVSTMEWGWKFSWSGRQAAIISLSSDDSAAHTIKTTLHTLEFLYDRTNNRFSATHVSEESSAFYFHWELVAVWRWDISYGKYLLRYNTIFDETRNPIAVDAPISCFYGRSETLKTVNYRVHNLEPAVDITTPYDKCDKVRSGEGLTRSTKGYHHYIQYRVEIYTKGYSDNPGSIVTRNNTMSGGAVECWRTSGEIEYEQGAQFRTPHTGIYTCNQPTSGSNNTRCYSTFYATTYARIERQFEVRREPTPRLFIIHPLLDSESVIVGVRERFVDNPVARLVSSGAGILYGTALFPYRTQYETVNGTGGGSVYHAHTSGIYGSFRTVSTSPRLEGMRHMIYCFTPRERHTLDDRVGRTNNIDGRPFSAFDRPSAGGDVPVDFPFDMDEVYTANGWNSFFKSIENPFGVTELGSFIAALQSAYARDLVVFVPSLNKFSSDDSYRKLNGNAFVGWA